MLKLTNHLLQKHDGHTGRWSSADLSCAPLPVHCPCTCCVWVCWKSAPVKLRAQGIVGSEWSITPRLAAVQGDGLEITPV